jgi:phosphoribosylaminoimidazole-succinocarboxamide synthase
MPMKHNFIPRRKVYEGKSKIFFEGPEVSTLIQHFKDDVNINSKTIVVNGKGIVNNKTSEHLMCKLAEAGIKNHYIRKINMREHVVKALEVFPLQVVIRNAPSESLCAKFGFELDFVFPHPIIEYYFKSYSGEPVMVNDEHILGFEWASDTDLHAIRSIALRVNDFLQGYMLAVDLRLINISLEFGKSHKALNMNRDVYEIILADELTLDNCQVVDLNEESCFNDITHIEDDSLLKTYQAFAKRLNVKGALAMSTFTRVI